LFLWAVAENVETVMVEELSREFGPELTAKVKAISRFSLMASVMLQQYASPIVGGKLTSVGARQLCMGDFKSGSLPPNSRADPNGTGMEGRTALMDSVIAGDVETTKALIRCGANPNHKDSSGATALHLGAALLNVDVVKALLDSKASPHEVDQAGFSPWMVVGEEVAHERLPNCHRRTVSKDGRMGDPMLRRELLDLLKPTFSAEEILDKLEENWSMVLEKDFAGPQIELEALTARFRLHESLFYDAKLADGHGAHDGRRERTPLLNSLVQVIKELLRTEDLKGPQKVLTRYLLTATMGPCFGHTCAHVYTPWPTEDNRGSYRAVMMQVAKEMLGKFADECNLMRQRIDFLAENVPEGPCAKLAAVAADMVKVPEAWLCEEHPDHLCWRAVQSEQSLRFDPQWALEVDGSIAGVNLALIRLGAVADLAGCCELQQVHHATMAEMFARGYIKYSNLCNEPFQRKMHAVGERVSRREGIDARPPTHFVGAKKLKRLMEKVQEKREDLKEYSEWPGRSDLYFRHSQAFCILDTVRLSFTCHGETTEAQVACCMDLFHEFCNCTVEKDGLCVIRQKNGFAAGVHGAGGYADVKLLVYADLGTHTAFDGTEMPLQIVGEVQLILDSYMKVKNKMHLVYELDRGSFDHKQEHPDEAAVHA